MKSLEVLALELHEAAKNAKEIDQISLNQPITLDDAYEIQRISISHRISEGETLIGLKMGFTSEAKMKQMGVNDMIWGRLTSTMLLENGNTTAMSKYIHPRAEPEICFMISRDIDRELSVEEVKECVSGVSAAIEIIDSRYRNFKFSLEDVVADNCSSIGFVVGEWHDPKTNIGNLAIELGIDGTVAERGNSDDILGDPWKALAAATRLAAKYGEPIKKGMFIMAGAASAAAFIQQGQTISASVESLGTLNFSVE